MDLDKEPPIWGSVVVNGPPGNLINDEMSEIKAKLDQVIEELNDRPEDRRQPNDTEWEARVRDAFARIYDEAFEKGYLAAEGDYRENEVFMRPIIPDNPYRD